MPQYNPTPLQKAKAIVRSKRRALYGVTNYDEYMKGFERGVKDAKAGDSFGERCHKITRSIALGYYYGWRSEKLRARYKNGNK